MNKVLLTGFEPFGDDAINPSAEIARDLHGVVIRNHEVVGALLPCVFRKAIADVKRLMSRHDPVLVIALGVAGGRAEITPERVAINVDDARIPDNAGAQPVDRAIAARGPAAYWSTLPIKAIVGELKRAGVPAAVSQTAGTFVCNHVFYGLMHELARTRSRARGGFIHVPHLPQQTQKGRPAMPFDQMVTGIALAVETAIRVKRDVKLAGGAER